MFSYTCKTAIKVTIYLASKFGTGENAGIREISQYIGASEHTIGKLMQTLVKQGIVNSVKGPAGGFYISKEQMKYPLMRIVEAIDGGRFFKECGLGLNKCSASRPCPIHNEYKEARDRIETLFNSRKIADLREHVNDGIAFLV